MIHRVLGSGRSRPFVKPFEECAECQRLWHDYAGSTHHVFKLKSKARLASLAHQRAAETALAEELLEAQRTQLAAWRAFRQHQLAAHRNEARQEDQATSAARELEQRRLRAALDKARAEYRKIAANQDNIIRDIPSGLPHPDGSFRLQQVARQRSAAYRRFLDAHFALERFLAGQEIESDKT